MDDYKLHDISGSMLYAKIQMHILRNLDCFSAEVSFGNPGTVEQS